MPRNRLTDSMVVLAAISIIGFIGWRAGAESGAQRYVAPTTVVIVDIAKVINNLDEREAESLAFEARTTQRQAKLDELKREVEAAEQALQDMPDNAPGRAERTLEVMEGADTYSNRTRFYLALGDQERGDITADLYNKITVAIGELAAKNGYDLVVLDDRGLELPSGERADVINAAITEKAVLYASPNLDISQQVIDFMNAKFQAGAG